jgi:hypothetical protein
MVQLEQLPVVDDLTLTVASLTILQCCKFSINFQTVSTLSGILFGSAAPVLRNRRLRLDSCDAALS